MGIIDGTEPRYDPTGRYHQGGTKHPHAADLWVCHDCGVAPGRFAWLLEDVQATTDRCPACWGHPNWPTMRIEGGSRSCWSCNRTFTFNMMRDPGPDHCDCRASRAIACPTCLGAGKCDPIPARGKQGLWRWTP